MQQNDPADDMQLVAAAMHALERETNVARSDHRLIWAKTQARLQLARAQRAAAPVETWSLATGCLISLAGIALILVFGQNDGAGTLLSTRSLLDPFFFIALPALAVTSVAALVWSAVDRSSDCSARRERGR